jgi:hypothetical protein
MTDTDGNTYGWDCVDRRVAAPIDDEGTFRWACPYENNALPDLTDPCTLGGLEALVRERWGDGAHASPDRGRNPNPDWWVWRKIIDGWTVVARGPTRAAALVAALEAP